MIHALTYTLTDGQYWGLVLIGTFISAFGTGLVACIAEKFMGERG